MKILKVENVKKSFDGIHALDNVSFTFESGRVTGLVGPNGAGKTTIFNTICGFLLPDSGRIHYDGINLVGLAPWQIASVGIGRLFQDVRVFSRMTVLDNVIVSFNNQAGERLIRSVIARRKVRREEQRFKEQAQQLLANVGLLDASGRLAGDLSFGEQKLLAITRLLAANSNVLLLDEPSAGVSPTGLKLLLSLISKLAKAGKTVVLIEHNIDFVLEVTNLVYFVSGGCVVAAGHPKEVLNNPEIKATYMGL